jgi:two-component system, cell cycle response regulator DivK
VSTNELILIVEDNEKSLKLVRDLLIFHGYRTLEARTGADGVALARAHHPDLILMDIEMPVMDGVAALRQIRADPATAEIPVLAVTASAMRADRERYIGAGFNGYFIKPIDIKEFPQQMRAYLRNRGS